MSKSETRSSKSPVESGDAPALAVIGCGAIAEQYYLPALTRYPAVAANLILVDQNEERAEAMARKFDLSRWTTDYRNVLDDVKGAVVAVPTHFHHPISMDLLGHGLHVLCEKPLADSAEKAQQMVEQAEKNGVALAANYQRRLYPNLAKVHHLLQSGDLGKPRLIDYRVGEKFDWPTVSGFYFNAAYQARGILRDRGAHVIDVICWWLGAKPQLRRSENDAFGGSEAVAFVEFEHNGCVGQVKLSWLSKFPSTYRVQCEEATVKGDLYDYRTVVVETASGQEKRVKLSSDAGTYAGIAGKMVTNFIRVVTGQETPLVPGRDTLNSLQLVDECYATATQFDMPWYSVQEVHRG